MGVRKRVLSQRSSRHGKGAEGSDPGIWGVLGHPAGHSVELK